MRPVMFALSALTAYLIAAVNPAILLSHAVYHKDIRGEGSGNPGFTNFRRVFGGRLAWVVFILDIGKAVLVCLLWGALLGRYGVSRLTGVAWTGCFAMLGHIAPVWYGFRGGKGFLVTFAVIWMLDWRCGLLASAVMVLILLTLRYMSLASMLSLAAGCILLFVLYGVCPAALMYALCVLTVMIRHRTNIDRLIKGTESKFVLFHHKSA